MSIVCREIFFYQAPAGRFLFVFFVLKMFFLKGLSFIREIDFFFEYFYFFLAS